MKVNQILTEMPQIIDSLTWHELNHLESNQHEYKKLSANNQKQIIERLSDSAIVYQLGSMFFCLDTKFNKITYYMTYEVGNNGKLGRYVWQSLVWTDVEAIYIKHLAARIFWTKLFPKFDFILTDSEQTWDGRRFWQYRIGDAFDKGLKVYFYDFSDHKLVKMNSTTDFQQFASQYDIWGNYPKHLLKRMVITKHELPIFNKQGE